MRALVFPCCLESHERWTQEVQLPVLGDVQGPTEDMKGTAEEKTNELQKLKAISSETKTEVFDDTSHRNWYRGENCFGNVP